jgi:PPOX class probable F420-dependent enzyme
LVTIAADGAPHAAPVWSAVAHDTLCFFSYRSSAKARNLVRDPRVTVHTESGEDVLIVRGRMRDLGLPADCPDVVDAFAATYRDANDTGFLPGVDPAVDVLFALDPERGGAGGSRTSTPRRNGGMHDAEPVGQRDNRAVAASSRS